MPTNTWTQDIPSGPLKNHALSANLRHQAVRNSIFLEFVRPEPGFGRKKGETLTIPRWAALTRKNNYRLTEGVPIPTQALSLSTQSVTVTEWGDGVEYTNLMEELNVFDISSNVQRKLIEQMRIGLDEAVAAVGKAGQIKYVPTGVTTRNIATAGTASGTAASNLNMFHLEEIHDYLKDTLFAEPFEDGRYVLITNVTGFRGLTRDPDFKEWFAWARPEIKDRGFMDVTIENMRIRITNNTVNLGTSGTGSVLGEALAFGRDALGVVEVMTPEIRLEPNRGNDFGRSQAAAWYGIEEFFQIYSDSGNAGEARVVHVTSA